MSLPESAANEATALLSTVIADLFEDANPAVIADLRGPNWFVCAARLEVLGRDVATLASAIEVLMQRSDVE